MVKAVVRASIAQGKMEQAIEWARKLVTYSQKAGASGTRVDILRQFTGETNRILFESQHSSMSQLEESYKKRRADSGWMAIVKEGLEAGLVLETTRTIFDVVEVFE